MSGTAALSAAKNRRSGNEVKFNGQSKSLPPPQDTRQQNNKQAPPQNNNRQTPPQQNNSQGQQMPHPMEILKSHESRLQDIEGSGMAQDFSSHIDDYASLKADYALLKTDYSLFKNSVNFFEKNSAAVLERTTNNVLLEKTIVDLQTRVEELSLLVATMSKHLTSVATSLSEHSNLIDLLNDSTCKCDNVRLNISDITLPVAPSVDTTTVLPVVDTIVLPVVDTTVLPVDVNATTQNINLEISSM